MSRRRDYEDDGRTIADMSGIGGEASDRHTFKKPAEMPGLEESRKFGEWRDAPFSWKERFYYMGAALGAALLIALVFLAGLALVIWLVTLYGK